VRIAATRPLPGPAWAELDDVVVGPRPDAEILIVMNEPVPFDAYPQLQLVANFSVGYDNIDVEECRRRGIAVSNTPGVLDTAVADLTGEPPRLVARAVAGGGASARYPVAPSSAGVVLRYRLDHELERHTYLLTILAEAAIQRGDISDLARAAKEALDTASESVVSLVEPFFGGVAAEEFKRLVENEVAAVRSYAIAKAAGNTAAVTKAAGDLKLLAGLVGRFLAPRVEGAESVWESRFGSHVDAVRTAVDALSSDKPGLDPLERAAESAAQFAGDLAVALARRYPEKVTG